MFRTEEKVILSIRQKDPAMIDYATVKTTLDEVYAKAKRGLAGRGGKNIELSRSWFDAEGILREDRELVASVPEGT
jgi:hypothetical protein